MASGTAALGLENAKAAYMPHLLVAQGKEVATVRTHDLHNSVADESAFSAYLIADRPILIGSRTPGRAVRAQQGRACVAFGKKAHGEKAERRENSGGDFARS